MRDNKSVSDSKVVRRVLVYLICITLACALIPFYIANADEKADGQSIEETEVGLLNEYQVPEGESAVSLEDQEPESGASQEDSIVQQNSGIMPLAGQIAVVSSWEDFVAALANEDVSTISLQQTITRTLNTASNNPGTIARDLVIAGNGNTINFGTVGQNAATSPIILGAVSGTTTLTLTNVSIVKTTYNPTYAAFSATTTGNGANWHIELDNVGFNSGITSGNTGSLINATNASVSVSGTGNDWTYRYTGSMISSGAFTVADGAALKAVMPTAGNLFTVNSGNFTAGEGTSLTATISSSAAGTLFKVASGSFILGKGAVLTAASSYTSTSTSLYLFDVSGGIEMGADSQLTATSAGSQIFNVGGNFTMEDGTTILTAQSTSTSQTNYQFNISGNLVMGKGTAFNTTTASTSTSDTYYQVLVGGDLTMAENASLSAKSAGKSLFGITGSMNVGERAVVTAESTSNANRQFSVRNFTAKPYSSVATTSVGSTYQFYITGNMTLESSGAQDTGATLTANSGGASNSIIYMLGSGTIDLGPYTLMKLTNSGTSTGADGTSSPALSHGIYGEIGMLNMQAYSLLDINVSNTGYRSRVDTTMTLVDGAVFNSTARVQSAVALCANYGDSYPTTAIVNVSGEGTQINLECSSTDTAQNGAAMRISGTNCQFNVLDGAEINSHSEYGTGLQLQGPGTVFNVRNGSEIEVIQEGNNGYTLGAGIRFRLSGNQTFNIDNSKVIVRKLSGSAPAMRLYGGGNEVNVTNGGALEVYNAGNGSADNGSGSAGNQGILYTSSGSRSDVFTLEGYGSSVDITADWGPAIYTDGGTEVSVVDRAVFILSGRTSSQTSAILSCSGLFKVTLDNPMYFDMRNNRPGGGRVISSGSSSSVFTAINSDLSVWKHGTNLDGNATRSWSLFNYTLTGSSFATISSTNVPTEFNTATYGTNGASDYSRMSANNATPIVDELRVPTNADKYIYGHVSVPEGLKGDRDAWTDEVYVVVQVKNTDGTIAYSGTLKGTTVGAANDGADQGLSVYGEPERAGIFVITVPGGVFLETGQTIEVLRAWRGTADPDSGRVHESLPEEIKTGTVTVRDVTPPTALTLGNLDSDVIMIEDTAVPGTYHFTTRTKFVSGTAAEIGATVYLYKNGALWLDEDGDPVTDTVASDGTWKLTFPSELTASVDGSTYDTIAVALNDNTAPYAVDLTAYDTAKLTSAGIFTNNGNENPAKSVVASGKTGYEFHDAVFNPRLEFKTVYYGMLELQVDSEISYGTQKIPSAASAYEAIAFQLGVIDDRLVKEEWALTATLEQPFTAQGNNSDTLNNALVYSRNGTETVLSSNAVDIYQRTNTNDSLFDVYNQWSLSSTGDGLYVQISPGDVKNDTYTAVVKWTLSDVP